MNPRTMHRNLIIRIGITAFIISVLFGFGAWQYGKRDIRREILLRAENGFKMLNNQIRDLFDDPNHLKPFAIQRHLGQIMSKRQNFELGMFCLLYTSPSPRD